MDVKARFSIRHKHKHKYKHKGRGDAHSTSINASTWHAYNRAFSLDVRKNVSTSRTNVFVLLVLALMFMSSENALL